MYENKNFKRNACKVVTCETRATEVEDVINDLNRQTELNLPSKEGVDKSVERITGASPQP